MEESWTILHGALEEYFSLEDYTGRIDGLMPGMPDCLFVLGGRDLSAWEVSQIVAYVREGGSALVTLSPYILDPVRTDRILPAGENPLLAELGQLGIYGGDAFIIDPDRGLYLSSGTDRPPDFYPLWFYTNGRTLFDYTALWSVPIHYAGDEEPIWLVESSKNSLLAGPLTDITPSTTERKSCGRTGFLYHMPLSARGKGSAYCPIRQRIPFRYYGGSRPGIAEQCLDSEPCLLPERQ